MDAHRFDCWLRASTASPSRRSAFSLIWVFGLAKVLGQGEAEARKKHRRKRHKHKRKNKTQICGPNCAGKQCGDNGCGGSCGVCVTPAQVCVAGTCVCASGFKPCLGGCIPLQNCCSAAECGAVPCTGGTCACTGQPDGTDCGNGAQCVGGICTQPPVCLGLNGVCTLDEDCCSGGCQSLGGCACCTTGERCHVPSDCCQFPAAQDCVNFACVLV